MECHGDSETISGDLWRLRGSGELGSDASGLCRCAPQRSNIAMDPIRVRSNDTMKPTHCLSQSFHISHMFIYVLHFFTCLSLRSIPALTKLTASPGQGHRKGMWSCAFLTISLLQESPRTLQGFSKAKALHVSAQFGPLPPGPKACAWTSISNHSRCQVDGQRKRIKKNQQNAKSSL